MHAVSEVHIANSVHQRECTPAQCSFLSACLMPLLRRSHKNIDETAHWCSTCQLCTHVLQHVRILEQASQSFRADLRPATATVECRIQTWTSRPPGVSKFSKEDLELNWKLKKAKKPNDPAVYEVFFCACSSFPVLLFSLTPKRNLQEQESENRLKMNNTVVFARNVTKATFQGVNTKILQCF